jgi:hypothetical protein
MSIDKHKNFHVVNFITKLYKAFGECLINKSISDNDCLELSDETDALFNNFAIKL